MSDKTAEKKKKTTYVTPNGTLLFANVVEVDYGTDKYPCKEGRFRITISLPATQAKALRDILRDEIAAVEAFAQERFSALKPATRSKLKTYTLNPVGDTEYDKDGNPTGNTRFTFKTQAFYQRRDGNTVRRRVPLFDSMAQPVSLREDPGNGSEGRVSFTCNPYFVEATGLAGLSLYLNAVMLTKLVRFGERSAGDFGFSADEGGEFTADSVMPWDDVPVEGDSANAPSAAEHGGADDGDF